MSEPMAALVRVGFVLALWAFFIWIGGAGVAAWVAWERGREPVAWFVLAFFLSPLVALIALGAVPTRHRARPRLVRPMNGAPMEEDTRWDVLTSAATTTRRP
jgi:hypothetical protein